MDKTWLNPRHQSLMFGTPCFGRCVNGERRGDILCLKAESQLRATIPSDIIVTTSLMLIEHRPARPSRIIVQCAPELNRRDRGTVQSAVCRWNATQPIARQRAKER